MFLIIFEGKESKYTFFDSFIFNIVTIYRKIRLVWYHQLKIFRVNSRSYVLWGSFNKNIKAEF